MISTGCTHAAPLSAPGIVPANDSIAGTTCSLHGIVIVEIDTLARVDEAILPIERSKIGDDYLWVRQGLLLCLERVRGKDRASEQGSMSGVFVVV
jgi:hypothetical protein